MMVTFSLFKYFIYTTETPKSLPFMNENLMKKGESGGFIEQEHILRGPKLEKQKKKGVL